MDIYQKQKSSTMVELKPGSIVTEITDDDLARWRQITSRELSPEQVERLTIPPQVYSEQEDLLAVHWHPEFVSMDLIRQRIYNTFPNRKRELIIPTQHNSILDYDGFSGVEIDCYAPEFNRKIQLLAHFQTARLTDAHTFNDIIDHTFRYRSRQLYDFIDTLLEPEYGNRLQEAAVETGADEDLVKFVKIHTAILKRLLTDDEAGIPREVIRNKLLRDYFNTLRDQYGDNLIGRAQVFLRSVKRIVKREFTLEFFYRAREVIEEARALGGGLVIPHPEQFWPILLADFDVDGYEVWNPQSREYTEFLINVVDRQNQARRRGDRFLMIFMGDDCHMGEKVMAPTLQEPEKASREIGVQPAWDDPSIARRLAAANIDRRSIIVEYRARLLG